MPSITSRELGRQGPTVYFPNASGIAFGIILSAAEEIGWRGLALPRLQQRWGSFGASGLLGVAWYLWHIPMFVGQGLPHPSPYEACGQTSAGSARACAAPIAKRDAEG